MRVQVASILSESQVDSLQQRQVERLESTAMRLQPPTTLLGAQEKKTEERPVQCGAKRVMRIQLAIIIIDQRSTCDGC
jgi:hypothetical protein